MLLIFQYKYLKKFLNCITFVCKLSSDRKNVFVEILILSILILRSIFKKYIFIAFARNLQKSIIHLCSESSYPANIFDESKIGIRKYSTPRLLKNSTLAKLFSEIFLKYH